MWPTKLSIQISLTLLLVSFVTAFLEGIDKTMGKPEEHIGDHGATCMDLWDKCEPLKALLGCEDEAYQLKSHCKKTCGECKQHADCSSAKYGCCPDNITPKQNKDGASCPECEDKIPSICELPVFLPDCNKADWAGKWMQENCKKTCKFCVHIPKSQKKRPCFDDADNQMYCAAWKEADLCNLNKPLMMTYCNKTCGFCTDGDIASKIQKQAIAGN